jgi:hypothetical protein
MYTHVFNWHHPCQRVVNVKKFWNKWSNLVRD